MKQHTVWHWTSEMAKGNYSQIGVIHNSKHKVKEDIIRIRCVSSKPGFGWDTHMRVDEALTLVAGISKTLVRMVYGDKKHNKQFISSAKMEK